MNNDSKKATVTTSSYVFQPEIKKSLKECAKQSSTMKESIFFAKIFYIVCVPIVFLCTFGGVHLAGNLLFGEDPNGWEFLALFVALFCLITLNLLIIDLIVRSFLLLASSAEANRVAANVLLYQAAKDETSVDSAKSEYTASEPKMVVMPKLKTEENPFAKSEKANSVAKPMQGEPVQPKPEKATQSVPPIVKKRVNLENRDFVRISTGVCSCCGKQKICEEYRVIGTDGYSCEYEMYCKECLDTCPEPIAEKRINLNNREFMRITNGVCACCGEQKTCEEYRVTGADGFSCEYETYCKDCLDAYAVQ